MTTAWVALGPEYARLVAYLTACRAAVAVIPGTTRQQRDNATSTINTAAHWINRLGPSGDLGAGVIAGTFAASRWVSIANTQGETLANALEALSPIAGSIDAWEQIVVQTAQDTVVAAKDTAAAVQEGLPWVAILVAGVAVLYVARGFR